MRADIAHQVGDVGIDGAAAAQALEQLVVGLDDDVGAPLRAQRFGAARCCAQQASALVVLAQVFQQSGRGRSVVSLDELVIDTACKRLARGVCGAFHAACAQCWQTGRIRCGAGVVRSPGRRHVADKHFFATAHDAAQGALFIYGDKHAAFGVAHQLAGEMGARCGACGGHFRARMHDQQWRAARVGAAQVGAGHFAAGFVQLQALQAQRAARGHGQRLAYIATRRLGCGQRQDGLRHCRR